MAVGSAAIAATGAIVEIADPVEIAGRAAIAEIVGIVEVAVTPGRDAIVVDRVVPVPIRCLSARSPSGCERVVSTVPR